jgi:hypothetical protein
MWLFAIPVTADHPTDPRSHISSALFFALGLDRKLRQVFCWIKLVGFGKGPVTPIFKILFYQSAVGVT